MDLPSGIDLKAGPLVASFFGAMAYAVLLRVKNPWQLAGVIFVGMATSYELGPLAVSKIAQFGFDGTSAEGLSNGVSFIVGLTGMAIGNGIIALVKKWFKGQVAAGEEGK